MLGLRDASETLNTKLQDQFMLWATTAVSSLR